MGPAAGAPTLSSPLPSLLRADATVACSGLASPGMTSGRIGRVFLTVNVGRAGLLSRWRKAPLPLPSTPYDGRGPRPS